jgi:DNA-binding NarL/FixJ family response regulator
MSIKILLVDDHKLMREGLRSLLDSQLDMDVIAEAGNGLDAIDAAQMHNPDIVIMDINMPGLNGIDATKQLLQYSPDVKVIGLSVHSDQHFVMEMLKSGASGYLLKDCALEELALAIRTVVDGSSYLSPIITGTVLNDYLGKIGSKVNSLQSLTNREREVLQMIAEGKSTKETAALLTISVKTVETHRSRLMKKLNLHTVAELTKFALREGLTSLDF